MICYAPISVLLLIAWCFSGLYALKTVNESEDLPKGWQPWFNTLALIAGPLMIGVVYLIGFCKQTIGSIGDLANKRAKALEAEVELTDSRGQSVFSGSDNGNLVGAISVTKRLIAQAIQKRTSDIFIDPKPNNVYSIRFRVDGTIKEIMTLESQMAISVISAIKVASSMDISEHRRPQDGAFTAETPYGPASFRIASVGAFGGEKLTIRVLGTSAGPRTLKDIGLMPQQLKVMESAIRIPSGLVLICGPTGSGKTSTLYALLQSIDYSLKNVISIEDPIENIMPSVSQMEVNNRAGITFSSLLRNALRQNPDIICLGEIRDEETAEVAVHASQTGHLIIATVHSNDNLGTVDRLMSLGIPLRTIAATLHVIVSQRLVRKLCHCKQKTALPPEYAEYFRQTGLPIENVCAPMGCRDCEGSGYNGRQAIFDVMVMTSSLRAALEAENATLTSVQQQIEAEHGSSNMAYEGFRMVAAGETSLEEVQRVTMNLE